MPDSKRRGFLKVMAGAPLAAIVSSDCKHGSAFCRDEDRVGTMYCPDCKKIITLTMQGLKNSSIFIQERMVDG